MLTAESASVMISWRFSRYGSENATCCLRVSLSLIHIFITAVKGQAANMNASDKVTFTPEELLRRTTLLMRHELTVHNCQLVSENNVPPSVDVYKRQD